MPGFFARLAIHLSCLERPRVTFLAQGYEKVGVPPRILLTCVTRQPSGTGASTSPVFALLSSEDLDEEADAAGGPATVLTGSTKRDAGDKITFET